MKRFYKTTIISACVLILLGGLLSIFAFANGARSISGYMSKYNSGSYSNEYEDINSLSFDIAAADFKISTEEGSNFKIEATNIPLDIFKSEVKDGNWVISYKQTHKWFQSLINWNTKDNYPTINITLPKDHNLDKVTIRGGAAAITIESLIAIKIKLEIGAGDLEANNIVTNKLDVSSGVGNAIVNATVNGDIDIDCGVGNIELTLLNKQDDFNYGINVGIGNVRIGTIIIGSTKEKSIDNHASYDCNINCGIGEVSVRFQKE